MSKFKLLLPDDFDEYAWEVEAKGFFSGALLEIDGIICSIVFYDLARLTQEIESRFIVSHEFYEKNMIILKRVTRDQMLIAADIYSSSIIPPRFVI